MKNFIFKSTDADLQKMFTTLDTLQKNVLYATHQLDKCLKIVASLHSNMEIERQATEYYQTKLTSPQTDTDEQ